MFYDRYEAGRSIAEELAEYAESDAIICAIPRGGVLTGVAVAKRLSLPMELLIVHKSEQEMSGKKVMCAVTEFGSYVCNDNQILKESAIAEQVAVLSQKRLTYTDRQEVPSWQGKTVIVVDDGVESGLTIKAVVTALQEQGVHRIIVALPAAPASAIRWLEERVDEVFAVKIEPEYTGIIQQHYSHYPEVLDAEVHVAYWHAKHMYEENKNNNQLLHKILSI